MDANEQFARAKYPCIDLSVSLMPQILANMDQYNQTSCGIISRICLAGMNTMDTLMSDTTIQHVSVFRVLGDLWQMFWGGWVTFAELAGYSQGTDQLTVTNSSMSILNTFTNWDPALQKNPFNNIGDAFNTLLKGVSP